MAVVALTKATSWAFYVSNHDVVYATLAEHGLDGIPSTRLPGGLITITIDKRYAILEKKNLKTTFSVRLRESVFTAQHKKKILKRVTI